MRKTLLLFTGSYPYSIAAENSFLPQEIDVLRRYFDRVLLIPTATGGTRETVDAPNVEVDTGYAEYTASWARRVMYSALSTIDGRWLGEVGAHRALFLGSPRTMVRALHAHVVARMTEAWISRRTSSFVASETIFYTWWFDATTVGLGRYAKRAGIPVITRAHGYDLYESRHTPPYIPFRPEALGLVTALYSASAAGADYLKARYPTSRNKVGVSLLGIADTAIRNAASTDGVFRIVSCSFLVAVKRIDLLIRGLAAAGKATPTRQFQWTHIGDGPERDALASLASTLPANVAHEFIPYPGKQGLIDLYRERPIDAFINTSSSEGTSVAIMEAIAAGIPVIATSVGGNPEIVGPDNGILIPANPLPEEIGEAINTLATSPDRDRLRNGSRAKWLAKYSAAKNYPEFAELIRSF